MKMIAGVVAVIALLLCASPVTAIGGSVSDPNAALPLENTPLLVSAFSAHQTLDFVELNNQSDQAIDITKWQVNVVTMNKLTATESETIISLPSGWLLGESYLTVGRDGLVAGSDVTYSMPVVSGEMIIAIEVYDGTGVLRHSVALPAGYDTTKWYQRKSGSSGLTGTFADFTLKTGPGVLRGAGLYKLPLPLSGIRIVELYARPNDCAPSDTSLTCRDYIKLLNTTDSVIDLTSYRLRTDSGSSLSGNAFHISSISPQSYLSVWQRDDGQPLSLTNDGGYVWFEDIEGVQRYDDTLANWPDASSDTRQGHSWAMNSAGEWSWSATPQPEGPNSFPVAILAAQDTGIDSASCPAGKYRSLETNRCRTVEEAIAVLAACDVGEVRNPDTNRCRKAASVAVAELTPCSAGQERNLHTNRCRAATDASDNPKPCAAGQERNPETNRCRSTGTPATNIATFATPKAVKTSLNVPVIGVIVLAATGYAIYEWRREITKAYAWMTAKVGR